MEKFSKKMESADRLSTDRKRETIQKAKEFTERVPKIQERYHQIEKAKKHSKCVYILLVPYNINF